jgi:transposase
MVVKVPKRRLGGLRDKPRSGRPPDVSEEKLLEIRKELSENPSIRLES